MCRMQANKQPGQDLQVPLMCEAADADMIPQCTIMACSLITPCGSESACALVTPESYSEKVLLTGLCPTPGCQRTMHLKRTPMLQPPPPPDHPPQVLLVKQPL